MPDESPLATCGFRIRPGATVSGGLARPPLDLMQDVLRRPTTRAERAAECCNVNRRAVDDGPGPLDTSGLPSVDGSYGTRTELDPRARKSLLLRGGENGWNRLQT